MAPGLAATFPTHTPSTEKQVPRSIFPDGIKTSGQHPPLYHQLRPYDEFPHETTGPTVWDAEDYKNNPERWTHWFTDEEVAEMSEAADTFRNAGMPLTGISKVARQENRDENTIADKASRTTSSFLASQLFSSPSATNSSMAKASYYSRAFPWRSGGTTSQPSHTWDWVHTWDTLLVRTGRVMYSDM